MLDWLGSILRFICLWIDQLLYNFIGIIYNLLIDIAETSIFTEEIFDAFASRIYALLGIFMLFKVSFSIITYIVNPDDFTDKNKGFSKLITNIIITLTFLIATPWVFNQAMDIQRIILRDNIVGKIFVGVSGDSGLTSGSTNPGMIMAYDTLKAFYKIDYGMYSECEGIEKGAPLDTKECQSKAFNNDDNYNAYIETLKYAHQTKSTDILLDFNLRNAKDMSGNHTMAYIPIISTACAVVILLLLIVFCFDVAVRSIKLGFLRMIAPVPIISRVDPKKGKEIFDKWMKTTISTYLDLFIRLLAIYFAVFVISNVSNLQFVDAVTGLRKEINPFVVVFIIMGALTFAKELPKLIEDITGIKMSGKFTLNPLKKLSEVPLAGKPMSNALGFAGRTAKTALPFMAGAAAGGIGKGLKLGASGLDNMLFKGGVGRWTSNQGSKFRGWRDGISEDMSAASKKFAEEHPEAAGMLGGIRSDFASTTAGIFSGSERIAKEEQAIERRQAIGRANITNNKKVADTLSSIETRALEKIKTGGAGALSEKYNEFSAGLEIAQRSGTAEEIATAKAAMDKWLNKSAVAEYIKASQDSPVFDRAVTGMLKTYNDTCKEYGIAAKEAAGDISDHAGILKGQNADIERSFIPDNKRKEELAEMKKNMPPKK